jgi:biofilm PGA synthesis N-glycosyltransferase PgaC
MVSLTDVLLAFAFFYPLLMSYVWMGGGLLFWWRRERGSRPLHQPPPLERYPLVSLVVPCYNEGENARETIAALAAQQWPHFEIIAVNDGSKDDTGAVLDALLDEVPQLRVIHLVQNQGKAMGLRTAAAAARGEFLVCIDGDALLDPWATHWMMSHLVPWPRVGAVTGNPRIRNRSTLLGRLQVGEFSSIIGLIKRAQRSYGRIFTVSGVIAAFRATALRRVGWWNTDMVTEDIDVTWRLQMDHWDVRYEPNAMCWILMPETLKGLWRQRLRWAQGGVEVALRYAATLGSRLRHRRMWVMLTEFLASVAWSYTMLLLIVLWLLGLVLPMPAALRVPSLLPDWHGVALGTTCLVQFAISLFIDRRYEPGVGRNYFWMIWYPFAFWLLNMLTTVVATPKALFKRRGTRATWVSPDRGL